MTRSAFVLLEQPTLSRATAARDELLRTDPDALAAGWPGARLIRLDPRGRALARDGALLREPTTGGSPGRDDVLLGTDAGVAVWAVPTPELEPADGETAVDLRSAGATLPDTDAGLLTTAVALLVWHTRAGFCAVCGSRTTPATAGWVRRCIDNGHEEHPRTDPAIIVLVHDGAGQVLLGRSPAWPPGRFSVLAGFVEAGESLEACVEREVSEEVGARVSDVHYLGSQPWPFPRSIMLGFEARADPHVPIDRRDGEIEEARWFTREEIRTGLERGEWTGGADDPGGPALLLPGSISIARRMLEAWAQS